MFGGGAAGATPPERPDAEGTFADVFDEVSRIVYAFRSDTALTPSSFFAQKWNVMRLGGLGPAPCVVLVWGSSSRTFLA